MQAISFFKVIKKRLTRVFLRWNRASQNGELNESFILLQSSDLFDSNYYLNRYSDVKSSNQDPLLHYMIFGIKEGRNPNPDFNTKYYLDDNPDVKASGMNPLLHYLLHGREEGRLTSAHHLSNINREIDDNLERTLVAGDIYAKARSISFRNVIDPDITVVIPVFNKIEYTLSSLAGLSLQATDYTFEVILADDHSTDQTQNISALIDGLNYVRQAKNLGFLLNCNRAAESANGKIIVFLNNDTIPFPNWLSELVSPLKKDPQVGLVGSMLLYADGTLQEAGGFVFKDGSGWNYGREGIPTDCRYNFVREVDYCSGASLAISRSLWTDLGGFDTRYEPAYYEDTDLAFRVREAGYKVIYTPFSKLIHFEGVSSGISLTSGTKQYQLTNQSKFKVRWQRQLLRELNPNQARFSPWEPYKKNVLLWIDALFPTPDQDSGSADTFNFLKTACEGGWGVTFVPYYNQGHAGQYTEQLQRLGIECWYQPYLQSIADYLKTYGHQFDVIVLSRVVVASEVIEDVIRYAPEAKIIFNTVDLHFLRESREREIICGHHSSSGENNSKTDSLKEKEFKIIKRADLTILISPDEETVVREQIPSAKTAVIPIARDIPGRKRGFQGRQDICFLGGFSHTPNIDAVEYFVSEIWDLVREHLPDCRFIVAGSNIPDSIQRLSCENIIIEGFVPELHTLFERVKLSIAPLRYGAGMKGKVVSSLSFGVPVVATSIAAEGMGLTHGLDVSIANEPASFANLITQIYRSEAAWERLSQNGLDTARSKFSLDKLSPKIIGALAQVIR
ncbi:MAG: glycosyltransferase [Phormidesmis sp.]